MPASQYGGRHRRHASRNSGDKPAGVLILHEPSCGANEMFAELATAAATDVPEFELPLIELRRRRAAPGKQNMSSFRPGCWAVACPTNPAEPQCHGFREEQKLTDPIERTLSRLGEQMTERISWPAMTTAEQPKTSCRQFERNVTVTSRCRCVAEVTIAASASQAAS